MINDEQLIANDVIVPFDSGKPGCDRTFSTPFKLSEEAQQAPRRAPDIGEHSREVLAEFGLEEERIQALIDAGVVRTRGSNARFFQRHN